MVDGNERQMEKSLPTCLSLSRSVCVREGVRFPRGFMKNRMGLWRTLVALAEQREAGGRTWGLCGVRKLYTDASAVAVGDGSILGLVL